jgi:putative endonuclease
MNESIVPNNYFFYLLINTNNNRTYIGMTNNLIRRLRQHNGDLVGGAKYTHNFKGDGMWDCYGTINNLNKHLALSIEKKIQRNTRKFKGIPLEKRLHSINYVLNNFNEYIFIKNCK